MPRGVNRFEYKLDKTFFSNMENEEIRDAELNVSLEVNNRGDFYELAFEISGELVLPCDRCLDDMRQGIDVSYGINVKYGEDYCDEADDLLIIPQSDNYLNVAYMIYDTVALAIPAKHVHQPGQCNRAMSAMLREHQPDVEPEEMSGEEIDEFGQPIEANPCWDKLKDIIDNN